MHVLRVTKTLRLTFRAYNLEGLLNDINGFST